MYIRIALTQLFSSVIVTHPLLSMYAYVRIYTEAPRDSKVSKGVGRCESYRGDPRCHDG